MTDNLLEQIKLKSDELIKKLKENEFASVVPFDLNEAIILDFSKNNEELCNLDMSNTKLFTEYVFKVLKEQSADIGIGLYNEDRIIYQRSPLFSARTIHMGIDLYGKDETKIIAPLDGKIHSFQDNASFGDYGPTIILEHELDGIKFHTLYGHLSRDSLENKELNQIIKKGQPFAKIGSDDINGNWPPHLHFEIITEIGDKKGDYPGVCNREEIAKHKILLPNPNLILKIKKLE